MKLIIEMALDNAAFKPYDPDYEGTPMDDYALADGICSAFGVEMDDVSSTSMFAKIQAGRDDGTFTDDNGNTVGTWSIRE